MDLGGIIGTYSRKLLLPLGYFFKLRDSRAQSRNRVSDVLFDPLGTVLVRRWYDALPLYLHIDEGLGLSLCDFTEVDLVHLLGSDVVPLDPRVITQAPNA